MKVAIEEAKQAYIEDEVPIGAVLVKDNKIISRNHNKNRQLIDPTAHAEILVLRDAAKKIGAFRLVDTDLFVTIEPCPMCSGAIIYSRIKNLYFGCVDLKTGCAGSTLNIVSNDFFNHKVNYYKNILEDECSSIIKKFFKEKRKK